MLLLVVAFYIEQINVSMFAVETEKTVCYSETYDILRQF